MSRGIPQGEIKEVSGLDSWHTEGFAPALWCFTEMDQIHSRETCELLQEHLFLIVVTLIPIILDLWVEEQHTVYKSRTH